MKKVLKKAVTFTCIAVISISSYSFGANVIYGEENDGDTESTVIIECDVDKIGEVAGMLNEDISENDILEMGDTAFIRTTADDGLKEELNKSRDVESVEDEHKIYPMGTSVSSLNDTNKSLMWYFDNMNAGGAWDVLKSTSNRKKVKVAVIDSGVDTGHEDLKGVVAKSRCMVVDADNFQEIDKTFVSEHGTHIAGIIGALSNNKKGVAGVASYGNSTVQIYSYRVFEQYKNSKGETETASNDFSVASAILYAVDVDECKVINLSLGSDLEAPLVDIMCEYAVSQGCTVIAAGGNFKNTAKVYPADYDSTISVIAATYGSNKSNPALNKRASFSSYGSKDICAPGYGIYSTGPSNSYYSGSGSSQAAAMVSAVTAMIYSIRADLKQDNIKSIITSTATDIGAKGYDAQTAWGTINAGKALSVAKTFKTGWKKENGKYRYYGANGKAYTGWHYMASKEGEKKAHWSYFGKDGYIYTGWHKMGKTEGEKTEHWSYFGDNGWLRTGWQQIGTKGNPDGKNKVHWSYFGSNGWLQTGWKYFTGSDGEKVNHWSYFGPNGWMRTGWQTMGTTANPDSGRMHRSYFGGNGWMRTGTVKIDGKTYSFDSRGWLR